MRTYSTLGNRETRPVPFGERIGRAVSAFTDIFRPGTELTRYGMDVRASATSYGSNGVLGSEHTEALPQMDIQQHPDRELAPDTPLQRQRCMLAYYNASLVKGIVESEVRQVCNSIYVQATTGSASLDQKIDYEWQTFLHDRQGLELIQQAVRHTLIDGGCLVNPLSSIDQPFKAQVVPYRLVRNPTNRDLDKAEIIRDGFMYNDQDDQIYAYVAEEKGVWEYRFLTGQYFKIPIFSHMTLPRMAGQTRGLSWYAAAISRLELLARWMDAMLQTMELHAYFVALAKAASPSVKGLSATLTQNGQYASGGGDSTIDLTNDRKLLDWARKHRVMLMPQGASLELLQSSPPQLGDFILWSLRFIARALGVSFERLTYDLTKTNFSSTKFGDRDDLITVREHQHIAVLTLREINKRMMLKVALENGLMGADRPQALHDLHQSVRFILPQRPPIDEKVFEDANALSLTNMTNSRQRICASIGGEWDHVLHDLGEEAKGIIGTRRDVYLSFGVEKEEALKMALEDFRGEQLLASDSSSTAVTDDAQVAMGGSNNKNRNGPSRNGDEVEQGAA